MIAPSSEAVSCPWCDHSFALDVPPEDGPVICQACGKGCEWLADGDIGPGPGYYLTKRSDP